MSAAALVTAAELAYLEAAGLGEPDARLLGRIEQGRREIDWRDQDRETDLRGATQALPLGHRSARLRRFVNLDPVCDLHCEIAVNFSPDS
jgi:hypothetical protein